MDSVIHPTVYDTIQRAGPENCFYHSSLGPVDAPGVGEPLDRANNLVTGSEIVAEQPTLSAQSVQGAGGGIECLGDDNFDVLIPNDVDFRSSWTGGFAGRMASETIGQVLSHTGQVNSNNPLLQFYVPDSSSVRAQITSDGGGTVGAEIDTGLDLQQPFAAAASWDEATHTMTLRVYNQGTMQSASTTNTIGTISEFIAHQHFSFPGVGQQYEGIMREVLEIGAATPPAELESIAMTLYRQAFG